MLTISSVKQLEAFKKQRALVTWFLDSGYTTKNIELVLGAKRGFDRHVGSAWHMLIPYKGGGYAIDLPLSKDGYGIDLSRHVIDQQGIGSGELPIILFENYEGEDDYFYVSLAGLSEDETIALIGSMADIVVDHYRDGRSDPQEYRSDITEAIKRHRRIKSGIRFVKQHTSTAVGALAGLFM
ncbi:hypothetical protein NKH93_24995 [Mesorhizobium sp. M0954]|uniref:hypothetical protein n=1 Tax=Mesorhizobium sp. M0954 TaxID=2957032 RepID=UPI00333D3CF2